MTPARTPKQRAFEYRWRASESLLNVDDYRRAARRRLPAMVWNYVDGGADDLMTRDANRTAFARWALLPRSLTGHGGVDLSTTVAGQPLSLPVLLAPTGFAGLVHWRGDVAAARAAERAGTRHVLSTMSSWSIEEVATATADDHIFQLYPRGSQLTSSLLSRAWEAGIRTLFVTVDVPVVGNREGERRTGMGRPPEITPRRMLDMGRHPRWLYELLRHRRMSGRNLVAGGGLRAANASVDVQARSLLQADFSWTDIAHLRDQWQGRLYVKGILSPLDATRAAQLGMDGIVVSNHGGRQLDSAVAALDALPGVVRAVPPTVEVLLDGGVRRGTDIVKALALGARAVLIGRPYLYGLAVGGESGVAAVLDIVRSELDRALTLLGTHGLDELDASWLVHDECSGRQPSGAA